MPSPRRPDIVVGIDIGQTCSGVAYDIGPNWSYPHSINRWPSRYGIVQADKVATRVGYSKETGELKNWGFECDFSDETIDIREQFKLTLDSEYEDDRGFSCHQARKWYLDYLGCLHREIEKYFDATLPQWRNQYVEFSFSTPTTWKNPAMIASVQALMESAGFGRSNRQSVRMALTEAEAAAIEASTTSYRVGDVFLICDAGGGTTDVNLLKVKSIARQIELEPLDHVDGEPVGSTLIDFRMSQYIGGYLELIKDHLEGNVLFLAEEMLMDRFQIIKHSFPSPPVDEFWLDVKGLAGNQSFPHACIKNSRMWISRTTLTEIFDEQVEKIFNLIDERLLNMAAELPHEQVSYIILSGGLGSSPYLYEKIQARYEKNVGFRSSNIARVQTMKVREPQLAPVRGLVKERTQQLGSMSTQGQEVFTSRRCRNSYGTVVREAYSEARHQGLPVSTNPVTKGQYVSEVIEWFIKQGQEISVRDGVSKPYHATLAYGQETEHRTARIVMSSLPVRQLPRRVPEGGCKDVAEVKFRLTENDMTLMNRQMWKLKKKYWRADFVFVTKLGPADLHFEILGKNGVLSTNSSNVQVEFMDPSEATHAKPLPLKPEFVAIYPYGPDNL